MYRRLTIRNYRSIEEATVVLGPFGLVVGSNGSGKSNVADAFVFARDVATDATTAVSSRGGISSVRRWSRSKPFDVHLELRIAETENDLEHRYLDHVLTIQSLQDGAWKFKKERVEYKAPGADGWKLSRHGHDVSIEGSKIGIDRLGETVSAMFLARQVLPLPAALRSGPTSVRRYRLSPDAMRQPQLVSETGRLHESGINIATAIRRLESNPAELDSVLKPMQRVIPGLMKIGTVEAGRHLLLNFTQRQGEGVADFSASEISEGALRALGVIVAAKQMLKRELLIIEEPEANVHAGAARLIFDVLKEASSRGSVLVTSHSPELLDAAQDETILVCDYQSGVTRVGPLASEQRALVREGLFRLAELVRTEPLRIEGDLPALADPA
ncbi:MAG: AAA family ATPase [Myxococcaceae bacterium]|nr:AAA family ATPase [Myxococcaceae bacterium]